MALNGKVIINLPMVCRAAFALGLCYIIYFFALSTTPIMVETDLKTISPSLSSNPEIATTIDEMTNFGEQRITLLLRSKNQSSLQNGKAALEAIIAKSQSVSLVSNEYIQASLIEALKPYRFGLLTSTQRKKLIDQSITKLVNSERRELYRLGADFRLVSFEEDPLAWFSQYLTESFSELEKTSTEAPQANAFTDAISLSINGLKSGMQAQEKIIEDLDKASFVIGQQHDVEIIRSGIIFFAHDAATQSKADIQTIAVTSSLAVLLLMIVVFRSLTPIIVAFISISAGVLFALTITLSFFGKIHILTIVFGTSLIGIVIDYSLHYYSHRFAYGTAKSAAHAALNKAMLLSMVTSFIGFGALAFSGIDALTKVATFSCAGLVMAWLTVMSLASLPYPRSEKTLSTLFAQLILRLNVARPKHWLLYLALMSLACLAYLLVFGVRSSDDPRLFFEPSADLLAQEKEVSQYSTSFETNEFLVVQGSSIAEVYDSLAALYNYADPQNIPLFSIADWLPSPQLQNENYKLQAKLYSADGVADQVFSALGVPASKLETALTSYANQSGQTLSPLSLQERLTWFPPMWREYDQRYYANVVFTKGAETSALKNWSKANNNVNYISMASFASDALGQQRQSATLLLVLAYGLVAVLWLLYYRSITALAYLAIPAGATLVTLVALPWLGQPITIFHLMALFLVLGLGMDYIVFAKEMKKHQAVTLQAILLSAITSLLSFGLLSFSSMPVVKAFGSTVLLGNSLNLVATIILFNIKTQERT